jgi:hypothetical protein
MTPETMPTDEKENLIAATEENVRYWTQRIMDELEEPWTAQRISQVIRELLTADTNESVVTSLRAEVEALKAEIRKQHQELSTLRSKKLIEKMANEHAGRPLCMTCGEYKDQCACTDLADIPPIQAPATVDCSHTCQLGKTTGVACPPDSCDIDTKARTATVETCPTCGSADKSVRESVSKPNCGPPLFPCQDAWHKPAPDPLAEVKAHHAKGGRVQVRMIDEAQVTLSDSAWTTYDGGFPNFENLNWEWRIHPDDLAPAPAWAPKFAPGQAVRIIGETKKELILIPFESTQNYKLQGRNDYFTEDQLEPYTWTMPEGNWHRKDGWREEWLQDGWRPLMKGEIREEGDQFYPTAGCEAWVNNWQNESGNGAPPYRADDKSYHSRTRRPLPSPPKVEMPKIKTRFINPPIPIRSFDWEATRDGYDKGDPIGFGRTEELAKADLLEQEEAR